MTTRTISALFVLLLASACTTTTTTKGEATTTHAEAPRPCPLGVAGADVQVEDTEDGVVLTFTSLDQTDELRTRVRTSAAMHGPGANAGLGHERSHGHGGTHGLQPLQLPPARATVEDVSGGARLYLTPVDDIDVSQLRAKARERAVAMSTSCR